MYLIIIISSVLYATEENSTETVKLEKKTSTVDQVVPGPLKVSKDYNSPCHPPNRASIK